MDSKKIAIIGSGSWATALVKIISQNTSKLTWYHRHQADIDFIQKHQHNPRYLTSVTLNLNKIELSNNLQAVIANAHYIILAIPSAFLHNTIKDIDKTIFNNKIVVSAIKGIVPEYNLIVGNYLHQHFNVTINCLGVITGPCHAEEVALERLSYLTVASHSENIGIQLSTLLKGHYIHCTTSLDLYGTEYSAVLKNIVAVAAGICNGLGYGDNFLAVLVSNAIQEMKRFVNAIDSTQRDIADSAYLGDLLVTAYSQFSRNRTFGTMLGKGYSVKHAQLEMNMIAEGYYATKCIYEINLKYNVSMPIANAVYQVIYNNTNAHSEIEKLTHFLK